MQRVKNIKKNTWRTITTVSLFLLAAFLIIQTFPNAGKFPYAYEKGGPWQYEALTSPFAFESYKSKEELKREQDSALVDFQPCYNLDVSVSEKELASFMEKGAISLMPVTSLYKDYISKKLATLYDDGILSMSEMEKLQKDKTQTILIKREDNVAKKKNVAELHTIKTAYEKLVNEALYLDKNVLQNYNLNDYIHENLSFNEVTTENLKKDLLKSISLTKGRIQSGEKIIDQGEIVSERAFDVLNSLKRITLENNEKGNSTTVFFGQIIVTLGVLCAFFLYLFLFRQGFLVETKNVVFMLGMIVALCFVSSVVMKHNSSPYLIPYAILPIMITTFFDTRTALFCHITTVLLCSFIVPVEYDFLFLQITIGMISICTLKNLFQRSQLVKSAGIIVLAYFVLYLGNVLIREQEINAPAFLAFIANGALLLLAYPLIYIIEKSFGYVSDVTLVELANTNNPLLRQFSEEAPGSFQHSMQVSNLAADAALSIEANPMLARTGALYHDIGKLKNPVFFTENQSSFNPHNELNDEEKSAQIIIKHVEDGIEIAKKHRLPALLQDFIRSHHGKNKTRYFYNSFCNKYPDKEADESKFSYPGPLPYTREMAVLMMCDAVEAASRSLCEYTDKSINDLVEKIINDLVFEGALNASPLTFKNIETVKAVLKEKLKNIYHTRISYPELNKTEGKTLV
ncbi:MAG: HDIG domain-containing protein [Prevotellaceae bacterium]|jgi:putative nucleotidyltransferase with HDIG domain|nr:HDIG domain-containing protein [Prevotellaceae bacterium]